VKVVVDEGVPRQLVGALRDAGLDAHRFKTDWKQITNGALIAEVEFAGFDVLITNDKNMANQQSLKGKRLAVVALPTNKRSIVMERVDDIVDTVKSARSGDHVIIGIDGPRIVRRVATDGEIDIQDLPAVPPFSW
jgi:predicted nuclease of predicted toxin-antitoxin system